MHPGERIALVGLSGSGKSSVVNMIPRFWNPTSGRILIDGVDAQDATLASLRSQIAIVSQDVVLFDGTIRENIAYAMPEAPEEEILRAVEAAALTDFISSLPQGSIRALAKRQPALGRPEAAHLNRAGDSAQHADTDSRRSDERARQRIGSSRQNGD